MHGLRLVVQRPYRALAFQHDHPFIQHFNDGLLFLKEQPQAELFRDAWAAASIIPRVW